MKDPDTLRESVQPGHQWTMRIVKHYIMQLAIDHWSDQIEEAIESNEWKLSEKETVEEKKAHWRLNMTTKKETMTW